MKKHLLFPVMSIAMFTGLFILVSDVPGDKKYSPRNSTKVDKQDAYGYMQWLISKRANSLTGTIDIADVEAARQQADAMAGGRVLGLAWEEMGPNNVGGRTRAFLIDRTDHNRLYAGGVGGGLWYSTNAGGSWQRINGGDAMNSLSVASICQGTDGHIYFGTGEGLYFNFGDGTGGLEGKGIYKSVNPSSTSSPALDFALLSFTWQSAQQSTFKHVNKMAASPTNPQRIYAATARGLRITNDGGANWINPLGTVLSTGRDVDVASDGTVLACVNNRGYRSASGDSGTYTLLSGGLPSAGASRVEFAIAPSDPNIMYACAAISSTNPATNEHLLNVYMSTNQGSNWTVIGPGGVPTIFDPLGGQGGYNNALSVAPDNAYKI
ncbi:MAG TPA: hypothetical protein VI757_05235, partial [Bacteroidia bacterium]|nr:hypothetical protein [Bacteroidia bacterium]